MAVHALRKQRGERVSDGDVYVEDIYEQMLAAAKHHGEYGVAFCIPVKPKLIQVNGADAHATVYLFHSTGEELANDGPVDPRELSAYAGLAAWRQAVKRGLTPRLKRW